MLSWLVFLLPVAALSGWMAAKKHYHQQIRRPSSLNPVYFKGLNYLLNDRPDEAIDVFIQLLDNEPESIETHQTLAHLFRRRGETERAVRIHQNLLARPTLTAKQRDNILFELAMDYMSAGVLDRAEQLFLELSQHTAFSLRAFEQLSLIYQREKEWSKAIAITKKIIPHQPAAGRLLAQFYCELAQQDSAHPQKVHDYIKQALRHDPSCVRAILAMADIQIKQQQFRKAIKSLRKIEQYDATLLPEALSRLLTCYQQLNQTDEFESWLAELLKRYPELIQARMMLASVIAQNHGPGQAQTFLYQELHAHPCVEGILQLITLSEHNDPHLPLLIKDAMTKLLPQDNGYQCYHCGFTGKKMYWHCPGCQQWNTVKPTAI